MLFSILLILAQVTAAPRPQAPMIESCDGASKGGSSSTHAPGEEWFSLTGHVFDPSGAPLCGERIWAEYLVEVSTPWGALSGPNSLIGRDGLFFLDNIKKDTPFRVHINPYGSTEQLLQREGLEALSRAKAAGKTIRTGGIERFVSEERRSTSAAGLITMEVDLKADPAAVGIVIGSVGKQPLDRDAHSVARIRIAGREDIETSVDLDGNFVVLGVPGGTHEVTTELSVGHQKKVLRRPIIVSGGSEAVARVRLEP